MAAAREQADGHPLVDHVVLREQHLATAGCAGTGASSDFARPARRLSRSRSSSRQIGSRRSACLIGLVRYAEMPSSRHRAASPYWPDEVSIMMVDAGELGPRRDPFRDAEPVDAGHVRVEQHQRRRACPACCAVISASSAAAPPATAVGCICQRVSCSCRMRRLTGLSSTTSTGRSVSGGSRCSEVGPASATVERDGEMERAAVPRPRSRARAGRPSAARASAEMVRPSPVPPKRRVVEPSAWLKASKMRVVLLRRDADAGVADAEVRDG